MGLITLFKVILSLNSSISTSQYDYQCAKCEDPELTQKYGIAEQNIHNFYKTDFQMSETSTAKSAWCNRLVAILTMTSYVQKDRVGEERKKKEGRKAESTSVGFVCSLPPTSTKRV